MRDEFYTIDNIHIGDILFDVENYRYYGELNSQEDCINAMVNDISASKVDVLAQDIAEKGLLPEHIIVSSNNEGQWIVREGNRRVLSLKLLNNPDLIRNKFLKKKFLNIISNAQKPIISRISCITSDDEDNILDYISNKHASVNHGAGLLPWNSGQKTFYDQANGKSGHNARAIVLLGILQHYEYDYSLRGKYITTIQRLINSREPMGILGISFDRNHKLLTSIDEGELLLIIKTIFDDFSSGDKNVKDVYTKNDRIRYVTDLLARLNLVLEFGEYKEYKLIKKEEQDEAPSDEKASKSEKGTSDDGENKEDEKPSSKNKKNTGKRIRKPKPHSSERDRVIQVGIKINRNEFSKIYNVYSELTVLNVKETPTAAAVTLRVFIELSMEHYVRKNGLVSTEAREGKLKDNMFKTISHLRDSGCISEDSFNDYDHLRHGNSILNVSTLQRYVHSLHLQPTHKEVNTLWDNIQNLILEIWR